MTQAEVDTAIRRAIAADRIRLSVQIERYMVQLPAGYRRSHLATLVAGEIRKVTKEAKP